MCCFFLAVSTFTEIVFRIGLDFFGVQSENDLCLKIGDFMERYLKEPIHDLLSKKILLIMGPRQVGKTTMSKTLLEDYGYYNYDIKKDLKIFKDQDWDRSKKLIIFDELHKMKKWKLWLKGLYDSGITEKQNILVTGSARLDVAKKMGDSLACRFFSFRMNPLDLKELKSEGSPDVNYKKLLQYGGFPEPFFQANNRFYNLWKRTHSDLIIRQDLIMQENIRDIDGIEMLIELLAQRVGSTVSYNSLAEDLQRDDKTIKKWLGLLEQLYVVFRVHPYSKNISRGIKKAGKYYFYDIGKIEGDESCKLENLVALSLKKELEFREDIEGTAGNLYFAQLKGSKEIDFLVLQKNRKTKLIEVKLSDDCVSSSFNVFEKYFPNSEKIQLVKNLDKEFLNKNKVYIKSALDYLCGIDFS